MSDSGQVKRTWLAGCLGALVAGTVVVAATQDQAVVPFKPLASTVTPGVLERPLDGLVADLDLPDEVVEGKDFDFVVTLTNTGSERVTLRPCPNYRIVIGESAITTQSEYRLNCADAPDGVASGKSVTFGMRAAAPDFGYSQPVPTDVDWRLLVERGAFTRERVRVLPAEH